MSQSARSSRLDALRVKAKLLQKAKARAGRPIALKDAFAILARNAGYASWRELKAVLELHEALRPAGASALWSVWYATHAEASTHLAASGGFLLPYQRHFFVCDAHYLASLGLEALDADVVAVGPDWSQPRDDAAWMRLAARLVAAHRARIAAAKVS